MVGVGPATWPILGVRSDNGGMKDLSQGLASVRWWRASQKRRPRVWSSADWCDTGSPGQAARFVVL